jgi:hypothetical protein
MKRVGWKYVLMFVLGMLTVIIGYILFSDFRGFSKPTTMRIVEDYGSICFWYDDQGSMQASVSPLGCYSTTCTRPALQSGSAVIDQDQYQIDIESRFVLAETSHFPLPCTENCSGGGTVNFDLGELQVGEYEVLFREEVVGNLNVFSGRPTPRQCIENSTG